MIRSIFCGMKHSTLILKL